MGDGSVLIFFKEKFYENRVGVTDRPGFMPPMNAGKRMTVSKSAREEAVKNA